MLRHGGCVVASDGEHESGVKTILHMRANEPHPESITRLRFLLAIVPNKAINTRVLVVNEVTLSSTAASDNQMCRKSSSS